MRKSKIQFANTLKRKLFQLPSIVNLLEKKDHSFVSKLIEWLQETEQFLLDNNIADATKLSGIRSLLFSKRFDSTSRNAKKVQMKLGAESMAEIQDIVHQILEPVESRIEEARNLLNQILTILSQSKTIQYHSNTDLNVFINQVWNKVQVEDQLKAGAVKLKSMLNHTDIMLVIAEEIHIEDFQPVEVIDKNTKTK